MNPETPIQNLIRLFLSKIGVINWRNNTGALKDKDGRLVRYGLHPGSSDIIAIKSVIITPEMVGTRVGIFTAIEVKVPGKGAKPHQRRFLAAVKNAGGLAGVAHNKAEAKAILRGD